MILEKTGAAASGRVLTETAGVVQAVAGVALVCWAEDRDHSSRTRMSRGASVRGVVAGARTAADPLVRGAEAVEALGRAALARTTHSPGMTSWTQTGASPTQASAPMMEETSVSQAGAGVEAGVGVEGARTAPAGLTGSREPLARWTDSTGRVAQVAEAEEAQAQAAGAMTTWTR